MINNFLGNLQCHWTNRHLGYVRFWTWSGRCSKRINRVHLQRWTSYLENWPWSTWSKMLDLHWLYRFFRWIRRKPRNWSTDTHPILFKNIFYYVEEPRYIQHGGKIGTVCTSFEAKCKSGVNWYEFRKNKWQPIWLVRIMKNDENEGKSTLSLNMPLSYKRKYFIFWRVSLKEPFES